MNNSLVDTFCEKANPEFRSIVYKIVEVIAGSEYHLDMDIKWGQLTFAQDADFHHWICAINLTKKFVALNFHFGGLLDDPQGVFVVGASKFLRKTEYRTVADVDEDVIISFLTQALNRLQYFKEHWKEIQKST